MFLPAREACQIYFTYFSFNARINVNIRSYAT